MAQTTLLAVILIVDAAVWSISAVSVVLHILRNHNLPMFLGFRSFGGPFSEALGVDMMVPLLLTFVIVNSLKVLAAYWLWQLRIEGAVLGLILIGVSSIYWYGFLIPGGPILGVAEVVLIILVWSRLG